MFISDPDFYPSRIPDLRDPEKTFSGSRGRKGTGSGSATLVAPPCTCGTCRTVEQLKVKVAPSVADPGCLFRILIFTHPGSRISDPGSRIQKQQQKIWVKKNLLSYLFCSPKFHKIENNLIFEMLKKKIWANFQRIIELFTQKIVNMLSKIWVWGLGSGSEIRDPEKTFSGSRGRKSTGSGSATLVAPPCTCGTCRTVEQLKGIMSPDEYFFKRPIKLNQCFLYITCANGFKFLASFNPINNS
jgi:hypothetical protein